MQLLRTLGGESVDVLRILPLRLALFLRLLLALAAALDPCVRIALRMTADA